jgi:F-type H+-transporting ATPase subunit b
MRGWLLIGLVLTGLAVSSPPWAWAWADDPAAKKDAKKAKEHPPGPVQEEAKSNIFKGTLDLAIWTVVVFLVLVFVLRKYAWQPILEGLDKREKSIASAMEEAKAAREEAGRLNERLQAEMNKAGETIRGMMDEARRNAEKLAADFMAQEKAKVQAERERLHREMEVSRDQALQQVLARAAELATLISRKAIRRHLSPEDHRQLLHEALAEFRGAGQDRKSDVESVRA